MKIRSKHIADQLEAMGWIIQGAAEVNAIVGIYDWDDPRGSGYGHDFHYGPLVVHRKLSATKLRRPASVSRRKEREVMQLLLAWQDIVKMAERRGIEWRSSYCPLGHAARTMISTAIDLTF